MKVPRVYVDTSVFGGTQDSEFAVSSNRFFDLVRRRCFHVLISDLTLQELSAAPQSVQDVLTGLAQDFVEQVQMGEEAQELADAYIGAAIVAEKHVADALHVALATVANADAILSWNFRHIVNFNRIGKYNAVNGLRGYKQIAIHSPLEVEHAE